MNEAEKAYSAHIDRQYPNDHRALWLAACAWQRERDAQIADYEERSQHDAADKCREHADDEGYDDSEEFMHNAGAGSAKQIAVEIRKQDAK